jgi:citrate synthase
MALMTPDQAAKRLGVKVETLYAYVSRGQLERHVAADGRTSRYDSRAVEALARRGRPRHSSRQSSLDLLIETRITSLSTQGVRYRGHLASDLALGHSFEQVADLLWLGEVGVHAPWQGDRIVGFGAMPAGDAIRVITALAGANAPADDGFTPLEVAVAGRRLIATIVDSLPARHAGTAPRLALTNGNESIAGSIAGRLSTRIAPRRMSPSMVAVLNAAMIVLADHELAASTLGVRVAASTRADPCAAVGAGLGVLRGQLHGGATVLARQLVDAACEVGAARAVADILRSSKRVPGFGHRVYPDTDPRATVLLDMLRSTAESSPGSSAGVRRLISIADQIQAEVRARVDRGPNVDFAIGVLSAATGMTPDAGEAIMAISRIAGWLAHAIEEYDEAPLRFRPRASYVGPS